MPLPAPLVQMQEARGDSEGRYTSGREYCGTHGPHWNMEQVKQVMEQREIDCDPVMFFAVLNAVYSDYYAVAKKHGVNKMDFYADLAKAWLEDEDAVEDKAGKYFQYIVKH